MKKRCEILFYSGSANFPAYYVVGTIEDENIDIALNDKLVSITQRVRKMFAIEDSIPDWKIYESLYLLREETLASVKSIRCNTIKK